LNKVFNYLSGSARSAQPDNINISSICLQLKVCEI